MRRREWQSHHYGRHAGMVITELSDHDVIDCEHCGFKHVVPLPAPESQTEFYEEAFYQSEKSQYLDEADEDFPWKAVECELRYTIAAELLGKSAGRALDIGSGPGDFLAVGKKLGWNLLGVEPSPVASNHARSRGLDVRTGFFNEAMADTLGAFDFIHLSEVLEHVAQPRQMLETAIELLEPGGILCISTPNDYNKLQSVIVNQLQKPSWWIVPDHHLNYFDFESLTHLVESTGLTIEKKLTNFPMELFLLMGQDYTTDPVQGRQLHGWRKSLDIQLAAGDMSAMRAFYEGLANAGLGRLAILFARKPSDERVS